MFIGEERATSKRVSITSALERKDVEYVCPCCKHPLTIKIGKVIASHFSHTRGADCTAGSSDMSQWHLDWQERFPIESREIVIKNKAGEVRRADVVIDKYVIEFQNSQMSSEEFEERNDFYIGEGYKVVWIFNLIEKTEKGQITVVDEFSSDYVYIKNTKVLSCGAERNFIAPLKRRYECAEKYAWQYASKTFSGYKCNDDVILLFQLLSDKEKGYLKRIVCTNNNFSEFYVAYYPNNLDELLKYIEVCNSDVVKTAVDTVLSRFSEKLQYYCDQTNNVSDNCYMHGDYDDCEGLKAWLREELCKAYSGKPLGEYHSPDPVDLSNNTMPFGKHKGKRLADVPKNYLLWVLAECDIDSHTRKAIHYTVNNVSHK